MLLVEHGLLFELHRLELGQQHGVRRDAIDLRGIVRGVPRMFNDDLVLKRYVLVLQGRAPQNIVMVEILLEESAVVRDLRDRHLVQHKKN